MPLRDHFRPARGRLRHWASFHIMWVNTIVRHLNTHWLPARYWAGPVTRLGAAIEQDIWNYPDDTTDGGCNSGNGTTTVVWEPPCAEHTFAIDFAGQDEFGVHVHDEQRASRLVASVELVSPANKDRPAHRHAFVSKCVTYLQNNVSVVVVDVITPRHSNLHAELVQSLGLAELAPLTGNTDLYAVAYRTTKENDQWRMELWAEALRLGAPLPTLPLWLASDLAVPLELEPTYEETCQVLRIP